MHKSHKAIDIDAITPPYRALQLHNIQTLFNLSKYELLL